MRRRRRPRPQVCVRRVSRNREARGGGPSSGLLALRLGVPSQLSLSMPRVVKRSTSQAVKAGPSRRSRPNAPLPPFVPPQLSQPVEKPPSGPQWVHEIKVDGFSMAARIERVSATLLTRPGLDWSAKYPSLLTAGLGA
jgi:ATP-dependent DNA ligase